MNVMSFKSLKKLFLKLQTENALMVDVQKKNVLSKHCVKKIQEEAKIGPCKHIRSRLGVNE